MAKGKSMRNKKNSAMRQTSNGDLTRLPQLRTNVEFKHRYRFLASNSGTYTVTTATLGQALGMMATTAVVAWPIVQSFKLNNIEVWSCPSTTGVGSTVTLLWGDAGSAVNTTSREVSDTSVSSAFPAHIRTSPPRGADCAFWQVLGGATLFKITVPAGAVIDLHVSCILADGQNAAASSTVFVGATAGYVYYEPLDGRGGSLTAVALTSN